LAVQPNGGASPKPTLRYHVARSAAPPLDMMASYLKTLYIPEPPASMKAGGSGKLAARMVEHSVGNFDGRGIQNTNSASA
jgi:hypothetical protein